MKNGSGGTARLGGGTTHLISMVLAGLALMASAAWADPPRHGIHSAEVPGGVAGALVVAGSPAVPERARFVVDLTRRFYNSPKQVDERDTGTPLVALVEHMAFFSRAREATRRVDPRGDGLSLARARDKAGHEAYKQWARALGLELKGGRKTPRLQAPSSKPAMAVRLMLSAAGLEMSAVAQRLNAGETLTLDLPFERVPLPLAPEVWNAAILERPVAPEALVAAILTSRSAALMYTALLSLDDPTRAWLVERPAFLRWIATERPATFLIAAPAVRVANGRLAVPGAEPARPIWEALADESAQDTERFLRRLLSRDDGVLASMWVVAHRLSAAQRQAAFGADTIAVRTRIDRARDLYGAYKQASVDWQAADRPFWRPVFDPTLALMALEPTPAHPEGLPGTERFWRDVFEADAVTASAADVRRAGEDARPATIGFVWGRLLDAAGDERRARADQVLYAARHAAALAAAPLADASTTIRAVRRLPALVVSLERAGVHDPALVAALARRAEQISGLTDGASAWVAQAQWQGAVAMVLAARAQRALSSTQAVALLTELAAIAPDADGRFGGALLAWALTWTTVPPDAASVPLADRPVERAWITWMSGGPTPARVTTLWEGTTYELDLARTLIARVDEVRRADSAPWADLAWRWQQAATRLRAPTVSVDDVGRERGALEATLALVPRVKVPDAADKAIASQIRDAVSDLRRVKAPRDLKRLGDASAALLRAADAAFARALMELTYSRVLADHETVVVSPDEAARRHAFGDRPGGEVRGILPWRMPAATSEGAAWHVQGALLGLDLALASSSLRRLSTKPLAHVPTLNVADRRTLTETVVLMERHALTDEARDAIADALGRGDVAVAAATTPDARQDVALRAGMDPLRASLWTWVADEEPQRLAAWVTPRERLFVGLAGAPVPAAWHAWGTATTPATGCLCTRIVGPGPWDAYAGRIGNAMVAVGVPDLQLRVAAFLADLQLPAALARDLLAVGLHDLVNEARSQDQDDWRALIDGISRLDIDLVEQYLGLLTVNGPLFVREAVPSEDRP
jgi:hypothetical protein